MSATMTGDVILFNPEPQAVYDRVNDCHRFFYRYKSYLPVDECFSEEPGTGLRLTDSIELEARVLLADIWINVPSPVLPFPDRSLVFLRGRIVLPVDGHTFETDNNYYVIYIESFYVRFRRVVPENQWTPILLWECARAEPTVIGKIVQTTVGEGDWVTVLIEAKDYADGGVETFLIGAIIPPRLYRQPLIEGSWVVAIGTILPVVHKDLYLIIESSFIRVVLSIDELAEGFLTDSD